MSEERKELETLLEGIQIVADPVAQRDLLNEFDRALSSPLMSFGALNHLALVAIARAIGRPGSRIERTWLPVLSRHRT